MTLDCTSHRFRKCWNIISDSGSFFFACNLEQSRTQNMIFLRRASWWVEIVQQSTTCLFQTMPSRPNLASSSSMPIKPLSMKFPIITNTTLTNNHKSKEMCQFLDLFSHALTCLVKHWQIAHFSLLWTQVQSNRDLIIETMGRTIFLLLLVLAVFVLMPPISATGLACVCPAGASWGIRHCGNCTPGETSIRCYTATSALCWYDVEVHSSIIQPRINSSCNKVDRFWISPSEKISLA